MKFKGTALFVNDIEKTSSFYQTIFGNPTDRQENSTTFMLGEIRIFLHSKTKWKQGMPPNEDHAEYEVGNLGQEINRLKNEGYKIELKPKEYYWGYSAYLRDPDGRMIELTEKLIGTGVIMNHVKKGKSC